MSLSVVFFIIVGAVSLAAAIGVVVSRVVVHSALFLLNNFVTLAVLYIMLDAQFLGAAQLIIYAGGIVILILFVIMLVGSERIEGTARHRVWTIYAGVALGVILLTAMFYTFAVSLGLDTTATLEHGGAPEVIGMTLYTQYILAFEMAGVLLLVALLGALLLARPPKSTEPF